MRPDPAAYGAAFADGRRLREAAAQRRRAHREAHRARRQAHRAGMDHHRRAARAHRVAGHLHRRRPPAPVVVLGVLAVLGVLGIVAATITALLISLVAALPVLVAGGIAVTALRHRRRRALRHGGAAGTAPLPARPAAPARPEVVWARARERFSALRAEYAAFECDPMRVLHRPALTDVTVASTARFVDAFAEAQALETESYPPGEHGASFVSAVDRAERAWRAAVEAADRIRLSGLSPAERGTVERVIKLLTTARDSDSDPERHAAYSRARAELAKLDRAGVVHLPHTAAAALDAAARGALPA